MKQQVFRVEWAAIARRDLASVLEYVAAERPGAARALLDKVKRSAAELRTLPLRGRVVPELADLRIAAYRELQIPPYRLIYRVEGDRVLVLGFLDSRRDLEDLLLTRLLSS